MLNRITWIDKLEKRFGKFCIKNLMYYITILTAFVYVLSIIDGSRIITKLYLSQLISFGSMMAGLLVGSGVGILVLYKANKHVKENLGITSILFVIGVICGLVIDLIA